MPMTRYERHFGAGPRGLLISYALLALAWRLESVVGLLPITGMASVRLYVFAASIAGAIGLGVWGLRSLPPGERGLDLVTTGAYKYVRHPVYASLLSSFNFGLAVWLNNWIYVVWAVLVHGFWHWNIRSEERLMVQTFGERYTKYCKRTGRFFPRLWAPPRRDVP